MGKRVRLTRNDGTDLGVFDNVDDAEEFAADDARKNGTPIEEWMTRSGDFVTAKAGSVVYTIRPE